MLSLCRRGNMPDSDVTYSKLQNEMREIVQRNETKYGKLLKHTLRATNILLFLSLFMTGGLLTFQFYNKYLGDCFGLFSHGTDEGYKVVGFNASNTGLVADMELLKDNSTLKRLEINVLTGNVLSLKFGELVKSSNKTTDNETAPELDLKVKLPYGVLIKSNQIGIGSTTPLRLELEVLISEELDDLPVNQTEFDLPLEVNQAHVVFSLGNGTFSSEVIQSTTVPHKIVTLDKIWLFAFENPLVQTPTDVTVNSRKADFVYYNQSQILMIDTDVDIMSRFKLDWN